MLPASLRQYRPGRLAVNTALGTLWQSIRIAGQALWVIVIARQLGPDGYGTFSGVAGLALTLGGFTGLGLGLVMHQTTSREAARFSAYWHNALRLILGSGIVFTAMFAIFAPRLAEWHVSFWPITAIGLAEITCFPVCTLCTFAFAAHERLGWSAGIPVIVTVMRLFAALCLAGFSTQALDTYAWLHLAASAIAASASVAVTVRILRPAPVKARATFSDIREGLGFSALWASGTALTSLDKSLVFIFGGSMIAGLYAAAYRLASVLAQPMDALASAAMPRLFRRGAGDQSHPRMLTHLALAIAGYASLIGFILWMTAGLLPFVLGEAFESAVPATRWLTLFLPCYGLRILGTSVLMASGRKLQRVLVETSGLVVLFLLTMWWVPMHGLQGAVQAVIIAEAIVASAAWGTIYLDFRTQSDANTPQRQHQIP
jgi:O-antigen/teichoic acid export membrane protein